MTGERPMLVVNESLYCLKSGADLHMAVSRLRAKGKEVQVVETEKPDLEQLEAWMMDCEAETTDGCIVEPDGICEHGHHSWLRVLGII